MKKISWITSDYYLDVDLPIINELQHTFMIDWQIVISYNSTINYEAYVSNIIQKKDHLRISFVYQKYRNRDLRNLFFYYWILRKAKCFSPDFYYLSHLAMPYGIVLYKVLLPMEKTIAACHNVSTPQGASSEKFTSIYIDRWIKTFKNIQVFSNGQKKILKSKYQNKNILMAPLAIKDYGQPSVTIDKTALGTIRFLYFGNIVDYKRVDLLIEAGNLLYEGEGKKFRICIAGNCSDKIWKEKYAPLIKYPEIFDLFIKRIPNEEVANLFASSHYFVMPYQDIAQSGAITVAFRYNLPTIVSDIEPFKEFVENNVTGITFKSEDANDLANKMLYLINNHAVEYSRLSNAQASFVEKELSLKSIVNRYIDYLNKI